MGCPNWAESTEANLFLVRRGLHCMTIPECHTALENVVFAVSTKTTGPWKSK